MTLWQLQELLWMFGIDADHYNHTLTYRRLYLLLTAARRWYGSEASKWLKECFVVVEGEGTLYPTYLFLPTSWDQLEPDLRTISLLTHHSHPATFERS